MGTGFHGTFVLSWSQTSIDGLQAAPVCNLTTGSSWAWSGEALRVDQPGSVLRLDRRGGDGDIRRRAAHMVRRLVGAALGTGEGARSHDASLFDEPDSPVHAEAAVQDLSFVVTDGRKSYTVTVIELGPGSLPLLMFQDDLPPRGRDLWVVHDTLDRLRNSESAALGTGVICFTPGTRIATPDGPRRIEELREGDLIATKDNGAQQICWIGSRRMSGARLFAMPRLRPIRIRAGTLGAGRPDEELLVSPMHRVLVKGRAAQTLFNTSEVLVSASDLVDGENVVVDHTVREITYIHLLLPRHEVVFANGVETESFHPAATSLDGLDPSALARLKRLLPWVEDNPGGYGASARRSLTASEAAILKHDAA
ncbi:Hint domain-containing protein [Litorisediminicola beolgyonensis]|uniref:Hint domain-containing protein n=1 Tax=Litorisediminicola beolgyonensis TaxID=1173614 RepID=A0ABW3ZL33_9RHOB